MIGITMGDANGVGPEIILRACKENVIKNNFVIVGDYEALVYCNHILNLEIDLKPIAILNDYNASKVNVLDCKLLKVNDIEPGKLSKISGYAAYKYIEIATKLALNKDIESIVTLPVNKESIRLSVTNFTGHTELIAELCGIDNYTMMLASEKLIVTHVSTHSSMLDSIKNVKKEKVLRIIKLTNDAIKKLRINSRIAVAGLNPHAGENGAFGIEDINEIAPAIKMAKKVGINAVGPVPADTVFYKALKGEFDAVVCMYHDQGHIPMKMLDFEEGVNITLGLPIIRTSVDHGTAFDIAYKGIASIKSFVNAYKLAEKLAGM